MKAKCLEVIRLPENGNKGLNFGNALDQVRWEIKPTRFFRGQQFEGPAIEINRSFFPIGRRYFVENLIFDSDRAVNNAYVGMVSKDNGYFIVQDDELFIQYDMTAVHDEGKRKSRIRINGEELLENERRPLMAGDVVMLGYDGQPTYDCCVKLEIMQRKVKEKAGELTGVLAEELRVLREKAEAAEALQKRTLEQVIENGANIRKISDLDISKFLNIESYLVALTDYEKQERASGVLMSREEYIDRFLGEGVDKKEFLGCLTEAQEEYIYYAAYYEAMAKLNTRDEMDYSAAFLYIGKLMENFVHQTMRPLVQRFNEKQWQFLEAKEKSGGRISLGEITRSFVRWEYPTEADKRNQTNGALKARSWLIGDMVRKLTHSPKAVDQTLFAEMSGAFVAMDKARGYRNNAAHSSIEAILASELKRVSYEDYIYAKNMILQSRCLVLICKYHSGIFKK